MTDLANEHCEACRADAPRLNAQEITALSKTLPDWQVMQPGGIDQLQHSYQFADFQAALDFANRVGALAESEGHHPALLVEWGQVTVTWWSHKIKGLHKNDFIMAAKTDGLLAGSNN